MLTLHKHIHTGEGGMLVTNDDDVAVKAQLIRNHDENLAEWLGVEDLTKHIGSNYRLTNALEKVARYVRDLEWVGR